MRVIKRNVYVGFFILNQLKFFKSDKNELLILLEPKK